MPFENGLLTRNPDDSHSVVHGAIGAKYIDLGGAESPLGYPTSNEIAIKGGAFQKFEHGHIYWSPETDAHYVLFGDIFDRWGERGWEQGEFGWPTEDYANIPAGGLVQKFQHGEISQIFGTVQEKKN